MLDGKRSFSVANCLSSLNNLNRNRREDLRVQAAYYPDPLLRTFAFADDTLAVYEGEIAIILAIRAAEALSPGTHTVESLLRVQACNDEVCLRPSKIDVPMQKRPGEILLG